MPAAKFDDNTLIRHVLTDGLTDRQIAEKYDMKPNSVATRRWALGLPANRRDPRRHDWEAVRRMYLDDFGPSDISAALGINYRVVIQILGKLRKRGQLVDPSDLPTEIDLTTEHI